MITLIESTSTSLAISWPSVPGTTQYVLQFRQPGLGDDVVESFQTLSDKISGSQARKRNLVDPESRGFIFRVGAISDIPSSDDNSKSKEEGVKTWVSHPDPFFLLSQEDEQKKMAKPVVSLGGSFLAATVTWSPFQGTHGYELQMRENIGGAPWQTIASNIVSTEVRKKNLTSTEGYEFRVRPLLDEYSSDYPFSSPSDVIVALGISDGVKNLFRGLEHGALVRRNEKIGLADALGGKEFFLLYASAHWCGPCRQFTPSLAKWYQSNSQQSNVEVVFLSCDHDESSFKSYFSTMPWLAVDFEDQTRERLLGHIRVTGIPRLVVVDGRTGRIIVDNAVAQSLDVNHWKKLAGQK